MQFELKTISWTVFCYTFYSRLRLLFFCCHFFFRRLSFQWIRYHCQITILLHFSQFDCDQLICMIIMQCNCMDNEGRIWIVNKLQIVLNNDRDKSEKKNKFKWLQQQQQQELTETFLTQPLTIYMLININIFLHYTKYFFGESGFRTRSLRRLNIKCSRRSSVIYPHFDILAFNNA